MKISIQHDDLTSSIEFEESSLNEFTEHLRNLLHTIWLPSQVDQIVPGEEAIGREFEEVRKEAYEEGYEAGGAVMREAYEPILEKTAKDSERLDWLIDNSSISMLRKDEDGEEWWVELDYSEAREDIDKAMEESQ